MTDPLTKAEAMTKRYGKWSGNPDGTRYDPRYCAYEMHERWGSIQCQFKPKTGPGNLYCGHHAKKVSKQC